MEPVILARPVLPSVLSTGAFAEGVPPAGRPAPAADPPAGAKARADLAKLFQGTELEFEVNESEGRVVVRVYDKESGSLLREIPPDEASALARHRRGGTGRLLHRTA